MKIRKFLIEDWLVDNRFDVPYNLAESGMRDLTLDQLAEIADFDLNSLGPILLEDQDTRGSYQLRSKITRGKWV